MRTPPPRAHGPDRDSVETTATDAAHLFGSGSWRQSQAGSQLPSPCRGLTARSPMPMARVVGVMPRSAPASNPRLAPPVGSAPASNPRLAPQVGLAPAPNPHLAPQMGGHQVYTDMPLHSLLPQRDTSNHTAMYLLQRKALDIDLQLKQAETSRIERLRHAEENISFQIQHAQQAEELVSLSDADRAASLAARRVGFKWRFGEHCPFELAILWRRSLCSIPIDVLLYSLILKPVTSSLAELLAEEVEAVDKNYFRVHAGARMATTAPLWWHVWWFGVCVCMYDRGGGGGGGRRPEQSRGVAHVSGAACMRMRLWPTGRQLYRQMCSVCGLHARCRREYRFPHKFKIVQSG